MFQHSQIVLGEKLISQLNERGWMMVTAESCTGGLIAGALTSVAGSSSVVHGGFITYANRAKQEMIGVQESTLIAHGAVSEQAAIEMAKGARNAAQVDLAISVTGIAGPGGGGVDKPVGLVHMACTTAKTCLHERHEFGDIGREQVRLRTIDAALTLALKSLEN